MKVWITKYALTKGTFETEAEICPNSPDMIEDKNKRYYYYHGEGKHWHKTKESALIRASQMKLAKISSLEKQLKKLNKLTFN